MSAGLKEQMMKRILATCVLIAIAVLFATPAAMADKVKHPSKLKYPKLEMEAPEYEEITFGNGMHGFFIEDHEVPVVNITMLLSTNRAPVEKTGLNDLAAWAIRNGGGENWDADRINDELEFVAAYLEFNAGARNASISLNCLKKDLP